MRITGLLIFATLAVTLVMGMAAVCCPDEDGCSGFCSCVCCGHSGLYHNPSAAAFAVIEAAPVQTAASSILVSFPVSPEFPPPEVTTFSPV